MPHSQHQLVAAIALGIAVLAGSGAVHAQAKASPEKKIYCWNEAGRKVCGDALPAEAANSERTEISARSGLRTGQVSRALSDSERSAAALAQEQARLLAEADAPISRRIGFFVLVILVATLLTGYTMAKSKRLSDFLDALSDDRLSSWQKLKALAIVWRRESD